jgi:hypothetical protein
MRVLYIEDVASHGGPESCVGCSRGRRRSVDRGRVGGAIEPRKSTRSGCRRCPDERKAMSPVALARAAGGPRAVREPRHARKSPCARTGRSCGRPWWSADAPSWMVRGVVIDGRGPRGERLGGKPSMYGRRKSDSPIVPAKPPNNPGCPGAEVVEGRGLPEGNTGRQTRSGLSAGRGVSSELCVCAGIAGVGGTAASTRGRSPVR